MKTIFILQKLNFTTKPAETQPEGTVCAGRSGVGTAEGLRCHFLTQEGKRVFSTSVLGSGGGRPAHPQWPGVREALGIAVPDGDASALTKMPLLKVEMS